MSKKDSNKVEVENKIYTNAFCYKNKLIRLKWVCGIYLIKPSRIMCTSKNLIDFCFRKQKIKIKKISVGIVCYVLKIKIVK